MRKVKFGVKEEIHINDITDDHIIGVQFKSKRKCTPVQVSHENWICTEIGEEPDYDDFIKIEAASIQKLLRGVVEIEAVYVFETRNELLNWLKD